MTEQSELKRDVGLWSATALNMIDIIGVGPFITIPLIISAMAGPPAMLGWILGAVLAMCVGMVWSELRPALPGHGDSLPYLNYIYCPHIPIIIIIPFTFQLSLSS